MLLKVIYIQICRLTWRLTTFKLDVDISLGVFVKIKRTRQPRYRLTIRERHSTSVLPLAP